MGLNDIRFYISLFIRRLPLFAAIALSISVVGIAIVFMLPAIYRSSATILVDSPQISAELAPSTVPNRAVEQISAYQQEIMTRDHLIALANELNAFEASRAEMTEAQIVDKMRSRTKFDFVSDAHPGDKATVLSISFEDPNPEVAAKVANRLAALILEKNRHMRVENADATLKFFSGEVDRLNGELRKLDAKILDFKNKNRNSLPDSLNFRRTQQDNAQQRLQMLAWEEASLRNRRTNLLQMFDAAGGTSAAPSAGLETLQALKHTLSEQLVMFSEDSPNIRVLRARINALEASLRKRISDSAKTNENPEKAASPMDLQVADIDQRLAFIAVEKKSIAEELAKLSKSIAATPENETKLNAMERDRQNVQSQYSAAVQRYAAASTGQQIELDAKGERLTLIEDAVPSPTPYFPKRKLLALGAILAGVASGAGVLVLLELLNQTIRRPTELVSALQIEALAVIPEIKFARRRHLTALFFSVLLLACLGQLLWVSPIGFP